MKELVELGKQLGYEGEPLRNFVREEQAKERDQRLKERELEKERIEIEREAEGRRIAFEKEKIELEKQAEKERIDWEREAERERIEREKRVKLEMLEIEDRNRQREYERNSEILQAKKEGEHDVKLRGPKLPPFEDDKDNMDSYLNRFERYATVQKWKKDDWPLHLSALLKGKALDVYSRLSTADSLNYLVLKEALLKKYELTEQGFRKKFKYSKPEREAKPLHSSSVELITTCSVG